MQRIGVYDEDEQRIAEICEEKDITEPELIAAFLDILDSGEIDLDDWV